MMIELDHTSSGAQIAAALAKDQQTAINTNLTKANTQADLYTIIAKAANKELKAQGFSLKLERGQIKKAIIAKIYGGTKKSTTASFTEGTGLDSKQHAQEITILEDAINANMAGLATLMGWLTKIAKEVYKKGFPGITITMPHGGAFTADFKNQQGFADEFTIHLPKNQDNYVKGIFYWGKDPAPTKTAKTLMAGFIQGLDAYILAKTQEQLAEQGIFFLAKHDAYLIRQEDAPALLKITQQVFWEIFQEDHLANLHAELKAKYGIETPAFSSQGTYDLNEVLQANYMLA